MQNAAIAPTERLLRLPEVAARLGLGRTSIYALIQRGELSPPVKLGGRVSAWPASAIDAFIARRIGDPANETFGKQRAAGSAQHETDFSAERRARFSPGQVRQNLGFLGKLFGSGSSAPTNIAGLVALGSLALIAASFVVAPTPEIVDARKWLSALITSALGFIFGSASKK
jgi:prophage regulatory protein